MSEIKYKPNSYGGIDAVELVYEHDVVYVNGELEDGFESIEEYLQYNKRLYDSLLECAVIMEEKL